jgi:DNA invertase Pin-like site-specific DNA recombinase
MSKKAIAYTSDIVLGRTGEVITRSYQKDLIAKHAAQNGIEIVAWFEDEMYNEDIMSRPGLKAMLACSDAYDMVLTERVWALSRAMATLETFFGELDRRGVTHESATTMWDCTSQKCRRRFNPSLPAVKAEPKPVVREEAFTVRIRKPAQIRFMPMLNKEIAD